MEDRVPTIDRSPRVPANGEPSDHPLIRALALRAISGRLVYGTVVILATLLAVSVAGPTVTDEMSAVLLATLAVVFAEFYSEVVGATIRERRALTHRELVTMAGQLGTLAFAAVPPLIITAGAAVGLYSPDTAIVVSIWLLAISLFAFGFAAGRVSGRSLIGSAVAAGVLLAIGVAAIIVKVMAIH
jgi:hypothetical protein